MTQKLFSGITFLGLKSRNSILGKKILTDKADIARSRNRVILKMTSSISFSLGNAGVRERGGVAGGSVVKLFSPVGLYCKSFYSNNFCCIVLSLSVCHCHSLSP